MNLRLILTLFFVCLALNGIKTSDTNTEESIDSLSTTPHTELVHSTTLPQSNLTTQAQGNIHTSTNGTLSYSATSSAIAVKSPTPKNDGNSSDNKLTTDGISIPATRVPNDKTLEHVKTSINLLLFTSPENYATTSHSYEQNTPPGTTSSSAEDSSIDTNTKDLSKINPSIQLKAEELPENKINTLEYAESSSQTAETTIKESSFNTATPLEIGFVQWNGTVKSDDTCKNPNEDAVLPRVLVGGYNGVYWADGSDTRLPTLVSKVHADAYSVDYHYKNRYVFYSESHDSIMRMNIDHIHPTGNGVNEIIKIDQDDVQLAVDWVRDELYWMSVKNKTIRKANLDGNITSHSLIYQNTSSDFSYPRNLVIDPYEGCLFFVDSDSVFRIDLVDNSVQDVEFSMDDPGSITCVALERHERRLYFSGINDDTYIASSRYDGTDVQIHNITASEPWNVIFSIDVYRDTLIIAHYTQQGGDSLFNAQLSNNSARKISIPSKPKERIAGIKIYHPNVQSPTDSRMCLEIEDE